MKITKQYLTQLIKEELSEADPKERISVYESFNWACGNLSRASSEMGQIFEKLGIDNDKLRIEVLGVYKKLDIVRKALKTQGVSPARPPKISEAQLRQIIKEALSEADPNKRKEASESLDKVRKRLDDVAKSMPDIFEELNNLTNDLDNRVFEVYNARDALQLKVQEVSSRLASIQEKLNVGRTYKRS